MGETLAFKTAKNAMKEFIARIGYRTKLKVVVFESDDWGAIRIPSVIELEKYKSRYPEHELDHYQSYDGLESFEDIERLCEVLTDYEVESGQPIFTLNYAMANPCFEKISIKDPESGFFEYEPITTTYARYFGESNGLDTVRSKPNLFHPQLHALEHLNATRWMRGVTSSERLRYAFELGLVGVDPDKYCAMDALNKDNDAIDPSDYLRNAATLFENVFGYTSESFISPCYVINDDNCKVLNHLGVRTLQGARMRNVPSQDGRLSKRINIFGKQNAYGQIQLIRNCQFEPSKFYHIGASEESCVANALADAELAFKEGQPAVFCTHRVNYTSLIDANNRDYSLRCLNALLSGLTRNHPDIVFTTSDCLGEIIREEIDGTRKLRHLRNHSSKRES